MYRIWLRRIGILLLIVLAGPGLWACGDEEESCVLCQSAAYHAPCLLAHGKIGELTVYDPHPVTPGALAQEQQGGTLQLIRVGDLVGSRDTSTWKTRIEIPWNIDTIGRADLCGDCRKQLDACDGPVLLDLYIPGSPVIYPVTDGADYEMRCYTVHIQADREENEYCIAVTGTLVP